MWQMKIEDRRPKHLKLLKYAFPFSELSKYGKHSETIIKWLMNELTWNKIVYHFLFEIGMGFPSAPFRNQFSLKIEKRKLKYSNWNKVISSFSCFSLNSLNQVIVSLSVNCSRQMSFCLRFVAKSMNFCYICGYW